MKFYLALVIIFLPILFPEVVLGQEDKPSHVQFHGSNVAFGQYANEQGVNSEVPASFWREDLNMTLTAYGIPISASFFLTSEQVDYRQSINNFRIYFDLRAMAINKAKTFAMNKAKGLANEKLPWMMRFMDNFSTLEVGKCRPNYSELTLQGIAVSGVNIEFNPGLFYAAFSTGKTKKAIPPSGITKPTYEQYLIFGKIGVGKKDGTHFYLTYMQAEDDSQSLPYNPEGDTFHIKPQANNIVGTEGMLSFADKKFTIEGEAAVSLLTRDTRSPGLEPGSDIVPAWLTDFLKPNMSSSVDYAYDVKSTLNLSETRISIGVRRIGAGYTSLGNPNLVNDRITYNGTIDQTFVKKQISFSAYFRQSFDNLINWKNSTTKTIAYGITAMFRFKKVPYFRVSYMPNFQSTESDARNVENSVYVIAASTGYSYRIGKLRSNTNFNFSYQDIETILDTLTSTCTNQTYTLNEGLSFEIPLSIAAGASYIHSEYSLKKKDILMLTLSGSLSSFESKWQNTLGAKYSNQDEQQQKIGFFWNSRVKLWNGGDLSIRIEDNIFRDICHRTDEFSEFIAQLTFEVRW